MPQQSLKNKAVKGVAWNTINTIGNLGVSFIVGIILARLLSPSDYGAVAMITVFSSVLTIFTDGGLTQALIRKENRTEADKATVFYYNVVSCYIIYAILFFSAPYIAQFYDMPILCDLTRISTISLLISPFSGIQRMHLTTEIDFKKPAFISVSATVISGAIAIAMAYNGWGVWSLAWQGIVSTLVTTVCFMAIVRWRPRTGFSKASFRNLFGFSSKLLGSQILNQVFNNITPLIVGKFFSPATLGVYERAQGWPSLPSKTFTQVLQTVTFPVLSKIQDDKERLANNYRRMLKLSVFFVFPMMVLLAALARPMTLVILTPKWEESIVLMQLLCFSMMWYPVHAINLNLLTVTGRSDYFFKLEVIKKILQLVVMFCALPFGLTVFCAAGIFTSILSLAINTHYTKKIINLGFWQQMKDLLPTLANSLLMGTFAWASMLIVDSDVWKIIVGGIVGISYYTIVSFIRKPEEWNELMLILKRK